MEPLIGFEPTTLSLRISNWWFCKNHVNFLSLVNRLVVSFKSHPVLSTVWYVVKNSKNGHRFWHHFWKFLTCSIITKQLQKNLNLTKVSTQIFFFYRHTPFAMRSFAKGYFYSFSRMARTKASHWPDIPWVSYIDRNKKKALLIYVGSAFLVIPFLS